MQSAAHTSKHFDAELENIRTQVLEMGGIVEYQIRYAVEALRSGDAALVNRVIHEEGKVNQLEREIDEACTQVIARRAPAANDLRLLMMVYKTLTDLERIGDEAKKVARMSRDILARGVAARSLPTINHVSEVALGMLRRSLDAFARLDAAAAASVIGEDAAIDEEFRAIVRQLITYMMEDPRTISTSLNVVWVAKAFERIGDHAKNIAENVIYIVRGRDVRHIPLAEMQREALGR